MKFPQMVIHYNMVTVQGPPYRSGHLSLVMLHLGCQERHPAKRTGGTFGAGPGKDLADL